jgi:diguanylate cyclase (GGDEF)-like protein
MEAAFDRKAMARVLSWFYFAGAGIGLLSLALARVPSANVVGLLSIAGVTLLAGALLRFAPSRVADWGIPAFLSVGVLLITAAVYFDGRGDSVYSLFYVWTAVTAFYFLPRWQGLLQVGLAAACYGAVLTIVPTSVPLQHWLLVMGTAMVAGLLVAHLRGRLERIVQSATNVAILDPVTGLLNRRSFQEHFDIEVERSRRTERPVSVLVGDIDGFKAVNEELGSEGGDAALEILARDLCKWKRRIDLAARIGGEEFALLLPESDERGAFLVAERLRRAVNRTTARTPSCCCAPPTRPCTRPSTWARIARSSTAQRSSKWSARRAPASRCSWRRSSTSPRRSTSATAARPTTPRPWGTMPG